MHLPFFDGIIRDMLAYHRTSILTSQGQTVVNTVNTVGVMGKGLASSFKTKYPDMFKAYKELCDEGRFNIGNLWLWKVANQWVLNFPTKKHWRQPSRLSYVEAGLEKFVQQYEQRGIREIAFPRLGCGNGGLEWDDVRPLMVNYLSPLPIPVYIHDFVVDIGLPEHRELEAAASFQRSFDKFIKDIGAVLHGESGHFFTMSNSTPFRAAFNEEVALIIERAGRRSLINNDELFELWTLLLRGPLTRQKMPGGARDSAYYLIPILAHLPYVRAIQLARKDDPGAMAVELLDQETSSYSLTNDNQGEMEWV